ncbi:hypothetical protein AK812_SmicGene23105 [Symbiodinium microadriaticum]|uniref:Uncharacterized protein n=1 Tax=Symbiodinium microadriaticum TaxID=2951 RepID=A0A1Q9DI23_SYMMI|nr:hypothetical protein AK812_SmicGene23105 [Symbiodinium microadriaticum]
MCFFFGARFLLECLGRARSLEASVHQAAAAGHAKGDKRLLHLSKAAHILTQGGSVRLFLFDVVAASRTPQRSALCCL